MPRKYDSSCLIQPSFCGRVFSMPLQPHSSQDYHPDKIQPQRSHTILSYHGVRITLRKTQGLGGLLEGRVSDHEFWDAYVSTRPIYSEPFYNIIHDYHASHSSSQDTAHDVGTGAGKVTEDLVRHYSHVVASDTDADHLAVAKSRLSKQHDESRVSYTHSKAKDLASHHPAASADMIATGECIVLMDRDSSLQIFATLLKPGGTLAAWFYGRPTFSDPTLLATA
ncbi:MAG: hypothetical protein L6R38_009361 [Xanthoria sp. 2 TBL-2021]|nr:MAG: hypothetical protein L6R38_009361 [Xanthoria sp. 2 TBL-2021]